MESALTPSKIWRASLLMLASAGAIVLMLVPVRPGVAGFAMPDLVFCLCCYWVLRRPASAPLLVIFGLGLTVDLLTGRPVGLGALLLLLVTEFLRGQTIILRDTPFLVEWLTVGLLAIGASAGMQMVLWLTVSDRPATLDMLAHGLSTALVYGLVAAFGHGALRLRYPQRRFVRGTSGPQVTR